MLTLKRDDNAVKDVWNTLHAVNNMRQYSVYLRMPTNRSKGGTCQIVNAYRATSLLAIVLKDT